jgi:hypothetical protein
MHGLSSSAHAAQFAARLRWLAIVTVFAWVVFPAADARGALLFAEWATIDATSNIASGSIGPVAVTFSGNDVTGGVTDNSFTGFNNAVFAPPLPVSDSVNFVTTLSRYIWTITFAPAVTDPRLHLYSHASVLNFQGIPLTKLSGQDSLVVDGSTVTGALNSSDPSLSNANGTVQLNGTFTSVIFTAENFFGNDENVFQIGADIFPDSIHFSGDSGLTVISMPWVIELSGDLIVTNNLNLSVIDMSGLTTVGGEVSITGNTSATAIDMSALTIVSGDLGISGNMSATAIDMSALATAGGDISITENTSATVIDMSSLVSSSGDISITDNTSATVINMGGLETASGVIDISGNISTGEIDLSSLVSTGEITIADNTSATVINMGGLETASGVIDISGNISTGEIDLSSLVSTGEVTITDNGPGTVNMAANVTVGGDMTIETTGSGTFDVSGADVEGNTSLTTDGYTEVAAQTAGGETAVTMFNSAATMEVTLPDGALTSANPVTFSIERLPGGGVETVGGEMVTHLETYAFDFAIPTLNSAAELNFEIDLLALDAPDRLALLGLLHDSAEFTLSVRGDAPGAELQLFDVCSGGGPAVDSCVVVQWLDENRMLLDQLPSVDPSILRFEALVGHFSTYSVVAVGLAGDYNFDGSVDAADYVLWRKNDGSPEGYDAWRANFGATLGSSSSQFAVPAVPEPTGALLLLSFAATGVWRHRRGLH